MLEQDTTFLYECNRKISPDLEVHDLKVRENVHGDQLNMVVFFWNLGNSDLSSVHVFSSLYFTSHF